MHTIVWVFALFVISLNAHALDLGGLRDNDLIKDLKNSAVQSSSPSNQATSNAKVDALSDGDVVKGLKEGGCF